MKLVKKVMFKSIPKYVLYYIDEIGKEHKEDKIFHTIEEVEQHINYYKTKYPNNYESVYGYKIYAIEDDHTDDKLVCTIFGEMDFDL